jgi:hypothetical protein
MLSKPEPVSVNRTCVRNQSLLEAALCYLFERRHEGNLTTRLQGDP